MGTLILLRHGKSDWSGDQPDEQRPLLLEAWRQLSRAERLVFNKQITGSFRVGV